jgi:hypothetical protein
VNKTQGWLAVLVFGLALCTSTAVRAHDKATHPPVAAHPEVPATVQRSVKDYNKRAEKDQKHMDKVQKKNMKIWKKSHASKT